ncbi:peroxiredoxin [Fistulifera solaris]|uniref:Peroxiredoxin n=1 Tax=Fistulifera solaris TaxID=1519565 RepID=A0A1Z5KFS4_FISSO|nr:peroxiredoxin [Fistulifera solaris]|eukprot:GAX24975.1 peroxiredoxin [Fistulifera solaris]
MSFSSGNPQHDLRPEWTTPKKEGDKVPDVHFVTRVRENDHYEWKTVTTSHYCAGKRIVIFALPGAFTPTCSTSHLPGYHEKYEEIKSQGIDEVYCLSVNDAFVMRKWALSLGLKEENGIFTTVKLIPDGACAFTRGMGMSNVWSMERGFGERSWRYSMVVKDCVIEKMFVEPGRQQNSGPDPFEVSDADTMLNYLKSTSS